jgi:SOS-response transcriptional repressor LexA
MTTTAPKALTARQAAVYRFIYETARDKGCQPSLPEIRAKFGITTDGGARVHLLALGKKGYIRMREGGFRSVVFVLRPDGTPFTGFADKP